MLQLSRFFFVDFGNKVIMHNWFCMLSLYQRISKNRSNLLYFFFFFINIWENCEIKVYLGVCPLSWFVSFFVCLFWAIKGKLIKQSSAVRVSRGSFMWPSWGKRTLLHVMLAVAEKGTGNREGIDIIPFHLVRSLVKNRATNN